MALQRVSPQDFSPNGTNIYQGFKNDDEDIKNLYKLMNSTGVLSLAGSKRQCVLYGSVDSSGNPNFLTASGLNISIDGSTKPVILSFANGFDMALGTKDILMSITSNVSNAWTIPANGTYYLYIDRDINTGILSYGYTATPDDYLKVAPASPVLDQNYFNTTDMKMYRYNGSAWEQKLRIFVASVMTTASAATITPYTLESKIASYLPLTGGTLSGNLTVDGTLNATADKAISDKNGLDITTYINKSGGTMTGALNLANGTSNLAGDDAYFGDMNVTGHFCVKGANDATGLALVNKDGSDYGEVRYYSNALHINKDLYIEGGACNASSGYSKLTNGVVIQWFQYGNTGNTTTSWPITFPNACFGAIADGNSRETRCYAFNQSNVSYAGDGTYGRVFGWGY
ncbi:hypothetical protein [Pectinatus frisingensis]|uniref:gp53-like domain-containing protein n=1 Tax=Pectinatus frisingensis TaxID=865 RepID=UPI0018C456BA|nr:hypothetical protein [Pectinatus frisingensis]